ncbi:MAG: hypothetical protein MUF87_17910 [Anaerolineae bacterium]|jgi:hypothetical protein|nr:hypothetical protein [Anaerolineae bacterium]
MRNLTIMLALTLTLLSSIRFDSFAQPLDTILTSWSADGQWIAWVQHGNLQIFDAISGSTLPLTETYGDVRDVDWHPQDNLLAIGRNQGDMVILEVTTSPTIITILTHGLGKDLDNNPFGVEQVLWSPTGIRLLSSGGSYPDNFRTQIWDMSTQTRILSAHNTSVSRGLWFPNDDTRLVFNTGDGYRILDLNILTTNELDYNAFHTNTQRINADIVTYLISWPSHWSPDGQNLIIIFASDQMLRVDLTTETVTPFAKLRYQENAIGSSLITDAKWNETRTELYTSVTRLAIDSNNPSQFIIWDAVTGAELAVYPTDAPIAEFGVSPFGGRIVIGTAMPQGQSVNAPFAGLQFIVPNPTDARLAELTQTCAQAESAVCDADLAAMQAALAQ